MSTEFLIGADPEVFVKRDGKLVCAHGLVQGDKKNPQLVKRGAVQVDGTALEFNINPAKTKKEFITNVKTVYAELGKLVKGYELVPEPVAHFDPKEFQVFPEESKVLGCDPDYNAYTGMMNVPPDNKKPMRTAAGHIHIGWTKDVDPTDPVHFQDCCALVKELDFYLGVNSLLWDDNNERRSMYGKAGAFRPKPYGVEYRVLSNAWLLNEELMGWVYDTTILACQNLMGTVSGKLPDYYSMYGYWGGVAAQTINVGKHQAGYDLFRYVKNFKPLPKHLYAKELKKAA